MCRTLTESTSYTDEHGQVGAFTPSAPRKGNYIMLCPNNLPYYLWEHSTEQHMYMGNIEGKLYQGEPENLQKERENVLACSHYLLASRHS